LTSPSWAARSGPSAILSPFGSFPLPQALGADGSEKPSAYIRQLQLLTDD